MATRSTIALEFADGTVGKVYCHWDGYLEHNGKLLLENYSDPFVLRDLLDQGDISSLGEKIGSKHPFSPHTPGDEAAHKAAQEAGWTTFYGRDRGETGTEAKMYKSYADYRANCQFEEYNYILRQVEGKAVWFVEFYGQYDGELEGAFAAQKEMA
jgi:hypothetical protein